MSCLSEFSEFFNDWSEWQLLLHLVSVIWQFPALNGSYFSVFMSDWQLLFGSEWQFLAVTRQSKKFFGIYITELIFLCHLLLCQKKKITINNYFPLRTFFLVYGKFVISYL
jgi:hypothetical protein